jgi:hypothetical protein
MVDCRITSRLIRDKISSIPSCTTASPRFMSAEKQNVFPQELTYTVIFQKKIMNIYNASALHMQLSS